MNDFQYWNSEIMEDRVMKNEYEIYYQIEYLLIYEKNNLLMRKKLEKEDLNINRSFNSSLFNTRLLE